ncbi:YqcC family protein [Pantoea sp. LMR881]|uniref:YqcC family protein n=1 Tax=Pantoea sp. LMR881 TaxID=3014336 RepID=UPI0022AE93AC|nr:YqcC family protein [Pantoea sp. LMR881]MCZ4060334.1 YqcC family protein [Pantoea sp. LMR881]
MTPEQLITQRLEQLEAVMREHDLWQETTPAASAFESREPFCLDTLEPLEWLQWVLIPRMHALVAAQQPLPQNLAIAPYFEMALTPTQSGRALLLLTLRQFDALFMDDAV